MQDTQAASRPLSVFQALELVGGLSKPSKMPCGGYSLPTSACKTGSKLAKVEGTICSKCYAMRGNYRFKNVVNSHNRRLASLANPLWTEAMAIAINGTDSTGYFRWHDAGDIQSVEHLAQIVDVCNRTPNVKHWLPTREYSFVGEFLRQGGTIPANLCIRLSALSFNSPPPIGAAERMGVQVSGASSEGAFTCPAPTQGNKCLTCRACWKKDVFNVTYKRH
jgi:hypothetical protein